MAEYIYKGLTVHYNIRKMNINLYQATGAVIYPENDKKNAQKFQTEAPTKSGVQHEIKKIINDYIDFEWKGFIEMQDAN